MGTGAVRARPYVRVGGRLTGHRDVHLQFGEAIDAGDEFVTRLRLAHARRRAGHDEVACFERVVLREEGDLLGNRPDHHRDVGVLLGCAVHLEPNAALGGVTDLRGRYHGAYRRRLVEVLAEAPRTAVVLAPLLQVA